MKLKAQIFRDGTSQGKRSLRALDPDYVAVDEKTLTDWIEFVQAYGQSLQYFNDQNQPEGDWSVFFEGDAAAIAAAITALDGGNSGSKYGANAPVAMPSADMLKVLAQPHFALLLTFLKLLQYPQQQFKALTQRRLDFYYRQVLQLAEKSATPDQAHALFSLAPHHPPYRLAKGTRLSAGNDALGNPLHYVVDQALNINAAQVASVKTLSLEKCTIDLETIHRADDRSQDAFAAMLRWAVGTPNPGDALPSFPDNDPVGTDLATFPAIVALFEEIQDYTLEQVTTGRQRYILKQLCFASLEDFQFCLAVHTREIAKQRGEPDIIPPTDAQWQQVYRLVEKAYRKKINRDRRDHIKQAHQRDRDANPDDAFLRLWQFALGDPDAGDALPPGPEQQAVDLEAVLSALETTTAEVAAHYIQSQLLLSVTNFRKIMAVQQQFATDWDHPAWDEVYRLLERAQTQKRSFTYPPISRTEIKAIRAATVADANLAQPAEPPLPLTRFHPFSAPNALAAGEEQALGVAIASSVLHLQEGTRNITLTLACQADGFPRDQIETMLAQGEMPFAVSLSSAQGWLPIAADQLQFAVGDFFLEPPLKEYPAVAIALIYQTPEPTFNPSQDSGQYLHFPDGSVYRIDNVNSSTEVQLSLVGQIGPSAAIEQYARLNLGGNGIDLPALQLSADRQDLRASRDVFTAADVGQFVRLPNGHLYEIQQFAHARRVGVQYWGHLPADDQTQKYGQITFASAPSAQLSLLTPTGMALTAASEALWHPNDVGTLWAWVNGDIYQLAGLVSDRVATVHPLGQIQRSPTPDRSVGQYSAAGIYLNSLRFELTLAATAPIITAPASVGNPSLFQTADPVIQVTLRSKPTRENNETDNYQTFKDLALEKANLQVAVKDLQNLQLRHDRSVLSTKSPFEPFDTEPIAGSSFYFAHPEIVCKKLDNLTVKLTWMGLPDSFATHYHAYANCGLSPQPLVIDNNSFQARLDLFRDRTWYAIATQSLFATAPPSQLLPQATLNYPQAQLRAIPPAAGSTDLQAATTADLWETSRYFRLELVQPDFQHRRYHLVRDKVALSSDETIQSLTVYPPYTPKLKAITLDYRASAEISLRAATNDAATGQIFQRHPFGYINLRQTADPSDPASRYFCLPQYTQDGSLFIGLRNLQPPQSLTLLFQLVSGSGNADLTNPEIAWSYLGGDRWHPFDPADMFSDGTHGLVDSGILHLNIPATATNQNHLFPPGLHWLRASVSDNAAAIPDVLDIRTQAVTVTFVDQDNDPAHGRQPLAAEAIQALVQHQSAIATVAQPYSSFGGRPAETPRAFYTRASERLRHKQRAVTRWDYERLVLEQFPQIYKVKCLTSAEQTNLPSAAQVTVVVIPNIANTAPFLPLEPKAPLYLLREIEAYLQAHTSPFVKVVVKNPHYEQIKYRVAVRFRAGYAQGYYLTQLNQALVRFLSPWAYEETSDISFGSSIHSSAVIHFLESQPYVDYVANLKLIEQVTISATNISKGHIDYQVNTTNLAQVKQVDAILVSAPTHIIDLITTSDYEAEDFEGIDYMIVGLDLTVT